MKFVREDASTLLIKGERNCIVKRSEEESKGKDKVCLENLENCDVYLPFLLKAAYLKGMSNCRVYVGCVEGACFVNGATNSVVQVCAHQLRIHNTHQTTFMVFAKQGPIIEDCSEVVFGPYKFHYEGLRQHMKTGMFEGAPNQWSDVKDFKWLRKDQSPNWKKMDEQEISNYNFVCLN